MQKILHLVETDRLRIVPLSYKQLRLYLQGKNRFEKEFGLSKNDRTVDPEIKERVEFFILPEVKKASIGHFIFFTFWLVIHKAHNIIVAELGFKGIPNETGEIEIGYSSFWEQRNKGIMTEAVGGMVAWAKTKKDIKFMLAETKQDNLASIRVVQKNGFENYERRENMLWWKLAINPKHN